MHVKKLGQITEEPDATGKEFTCAKCHSVITYTEDDVSERGGWTRTKVEESRFDGEAYVNCPVCGLEHSLGSVTHYF